MTLDDWIKWLELQRHNSVLILTDEQASEILKYLKKLHESNEFKEPHINELQEEIRRLQRWLNQPNNILPVSPPVSPVWENPFRY